MTPGLCQGYARVEARVKQGVARVARVFPTLAYERQKAEKGRESKRLYKNPGKCG